ncbi:MAG TPA: hypothetical protein VF447_04335, partial [Terriglobales bacterium]
VGAFAEHSAEVIQNVAGWMKAEYEKIHVASHENIDGLQRASQVAEGMRDSDISRSAIKQAIAITEVAERSLQQRFDLVTLQAELLQTLCLGWWSSAQVLLEDDGGSRFRDGFLKMADFGVGKVPVVGDIYEVLKLAMDIYLAREREIQAANSVMMAVELYAVRCQGWLDGFFQLLALSRELKNGDSVDRTIFTGELVNEHYQKIAGRLAAATPAS